MKTPILKSPLRKYQSGYFACGVPCEVCGVKNKKKYWRTFDEISYFRGDDETRGNLCDECYMKLKERKRA